MAGENEQVEQTEEEAIAAFNAGLEIRNTEPSTNPTPTPEPVVEAEPASKAEAPKPFSVTEQDWNDLRAKATAIDEIKAETKRQIDGLAGSFGGLKQQLTQLQQRGVKLAPGQLKRLSEHYPELESHLAADLNEILSAPSGTTLDPEEIDRRVQAALSQERVERQKEWLSDNFPEWENDLRSEGFRAYQLTLTPADCKELNDSTNGRLVGKHIKAFKELQAKATTLKTATPAPKPTAAPRPASTGRADRLEAATPAKGTGGAAPAPDPTDDFNAGWTRKGKG